jgi:hypothetical protein
VIYASHRQRCRVLYCCSGSVSLKVIRRIGSVPSECGPWRDRVREEGSGGGVDLPALHGTFCGGRA